MILDSITKQIRAYLDASVTTSALECNVAYADHDLSSHAFTPGHSLPPLSAVSATPLVLLDSPAIGVQRQAKLIGIYNKDTVSAGVTVEVFDGTNRSKWVRAMLTPDWSLQWEPGGTWHVYDDKGVLQIPVGTGGGASAAVTSNAISVINQKLSVHSQQLSVLQSGISARSVGNVSTHGMQSIIDAISNRISANVGALDVVSNAVSIVSNALSNEISNRASAVNVVSNALSNETSNRISVDNALSQAISIVSNALSNEISNRASAINVVSNAASNALSVANAASAQAASALSQEASVRSAADAAMSVNIVSLQSTVSGLASAVSLVSCVSGAGVAVGLQSVVNALSNAISAASNTASVNDAALSNRISILSQQITWRSNVVSVLSAAALGDVQSMGPISMAASALYELHGMMIYECGTSGGFAFGMSLPALGAGGSWIRMVTNSVAAGQAATGNEGFVVMSAVAAGNTAIVSISVATINAMRYLEVDGMVWTSAAGTARLMAKTSVAAASMSVRSGFLRALRIG